MTLNRTLQIIIFQMKCCSIKYNMKALSHAKKQFKNK